VLADARRRLLNCGGGAVEAGRRLGLADGADIRVIEFGNQLPRQYLLVDDYLVAPPPDRRAFTTADMLLITCLAWAVSYRVPVTAACRAYMERITSRQAYRASVSANRPRAE
jgi:hypothetical protein